MAEETVPCPGCAAPMPLDQEVCGACRRPRDEREIERGRESIRERAEKRRRRPFVIARAALAAAALLFAFRHRDLFFAQASSLRDELHREMQEVEDHPGQTPRTPQTAGGAAAVALLGGPPAPIAPRPFASPLVVKTPAPAGSSVRTSPSPATTKPPPPRIAVRPDEPGEPLSGLFRVYGVVYDLKTLQPVPHAVVRVNVPPPADGIETGGDGRYQIDFSPQAITGSEILVTAAAAGYREGQIEDSDPPYLLWPLKKRLELTLGLTATDMEAVPLRHRADDTVIPLDLVLVPEALPPPK